MDFSKALLQLKLGQMLMRAGWNGKGMWIKLQRPDALSKMSAPYLFMRTTDGTLVPWIASQSDLLSEDWFVIQATKKAMTKK